MSGSEIILDIDVGSPYTYLALELSPRRAQGVPVRLRPVLIGGIFKASGNHAPATNPTKGRYMLRELQELATQYGIPFRFPSRFPINTLLPQRVLAAADLAGRVDPVAHAVFRAYWVEDVDVSTPQGLAPVLDALGDGELLARASDQDVKDRLRESTDAAVAAGVFGLPAFHVGDRFWWGHDRIDLALRAAISAG